MFVVGNANLPSKRLFFTRTRAKSWSHVSYSSIVTFTYIHTSQVRTKKYHKVAGQMFLSCLSSEAKAMQSCLILVFVNTSISFLSVKKSKKANWLKKKINPSLD